MSTQKKGQTHTSKTETDLNSNRGHACIWHHRVTLKTGTPEREALKTETDLKAIAAMTACAQYGIDTCRIRLFFITLIEMIE